MKRILMGLALMSVIGCASAGRKQFMSEIRSTVQNSYRTNEPCNITCGKIKVIVGKYRLVR